MARENMREFGISDTYVYHLYSNWANGEETKMDIELHPPKPTQVPRWDTKRKDYCLQTITTHLGIILQFPNLKKGLEKFHFGC